MHIYVFEPQPELIFEIESAMQLNKFNNVTVQQLALSDKIRIMTLYRSKIGDGSASIEFSNKMAEQNKTISVKTTTLDNFVFSKKISDLKYTKCDVEGHELSVIKGGMKSIKKFKPVIQVESRIDRPSCDKLIKLITEIGYKGIMCLDGREIPLNDYKKFPSKYFGFSAHRDFFFEPL